MKTWVGSVLQGELKVLIPAGGSLRSSPVPQEGKLSEVLQFPKIVGTRIYKVDNITGQMVLRATCTVAGWEPEEPVLRTAEGFYVEAPREFFWTRSFAVYSGDSPTSAAIRIATQPQSQQANLGDTISLAVQATSANSLRYQWQRNGNDLPGANDPTLLISVAGAENTGSYWVKIWDNKSWIWSDIARVQLAGSEPPRLTINQDSQGRGILLSPQGTAGPNSTIEASTALIHWAELGGAESIDASWILDRFSGRQATRFYRLRRD